MPPCAAIECARRAESWKQNVLTRKPCAASDAAAEAPARPVPTTITVCEPRLRGPTSACASSHVFHLSASGPAGIFASSVIVELIGSPPV